MRFSLLFISSKGGRELPDDIRQKVQSDGSLVISPVQKQDDSGVYTCWARNKQGHSARRSGEVAVIGKRSTLYSYHLKVLFNVFCFVSLCMVFFWLRFCFISYCYYCYYCCCLLCCISYKTFMKCTYFVWFRFISLSGIQCSELNLTQKS